MSAALAVTRREAELVALARALLTGAPPEDLRALLERERPPLKGLTPQGARALEDALAKGAVLLLARGGGWRRLGGQRLWERWPDPQLRFTTASFRLLSWLQTLGGRADSSPQLLAGPDTGTGDELLLLATLAATRGTHWHQAVALQPVVRLSALCALGFAFSLGRASPTDRVPPLDLGPGSWQRFALDGLGALLADAWAWAEAEKARESSPARLRSGGDAQDRVLAALLEATAEGPARLACAFVLEAGRAVASRPLGAEGYGAALATGGPLRERFEARLASGALLKALGVLRRRREDMLLLRFVDDGYDEARAVVAAWDDVGPDWSGWERLSACERDLGLLRPRAPGAEGEP